jgi:phosphate transport system protein
MSRQGFHRELDRLVEEVVDLGREVESYLGTMVEAMANRDAAAAWRVVGSDVGLKERGAELAEECMVFQARQAPVARDLRLVYTVQAVTRHLVRAGVLCEHICRSLVESAWVDQDEDLGDTLSEMARVVRNVFHEGLDVFENRDVDLARDLRAVDDTVDLLYSEALYLVVNPGEQRDGSPEWRIRAALMVHYLERIADHGVDIGEGTVFLVTGERMEVAMSQYRERRLEDPGE